MVHFELIKSSPSFIQLDALRTFTRASHRNIKSCFTKTRIRHNKNKLKNQDTLAREFRLDIYYSIVASLRILLFQVVSLNHFVSRMKHSCLRIYGELVCKAFSRSFSQLLAITLYMLAEIVRSSFTGRGDPSKLCS